MQGLTKSKCCISCPLTFEWNLWAGFEISSDGLPTLNGTKQHHDRRRGTRGALGGKIQKQRIHAGEIRTY